VLSLIEIPPFSLGTSLEIFCLLLIKEANDGSHLVSFLAIFDNLVNDATIFFKCDDATIHG
jgi:hypothetical protein